MTYLAILFIVDRIGNQTVSYRTTVQSTDLQSVWTALHLFSHTDPNETDTIILIANGLDGQPPYVVNNWSNGNCDFLGLT